MKSFSHKNDFFGGSLHGQVACFMWTQLRRMVFGSVVSGILDSELCSAATIYPNLQLVAYEANVKKSKKSRCIGRKM